ncbi:hypothetical protein CsatA_009617 [Cannabis sativa]
MFRKRWWTAKSNKMQPILFGASKSSYANAQLQQPAQPKDEKDDEKNIPAASNSSNANAKPQQPPKLKDEKDDKKDEKNEHYSKERETKLKTIFNVDDPFPDLGKCMIFFLYKCTLT